MGSRYGVKIRKREGAILKSTRAKHECPSCGKRKVKRAGSSLWKCKSCGTTFAGGSYSPETEAGATAKKIIETAKA